MDNVKREMLYVSALAATHNQRNKLLDFWSDCGINPTEAEADEITKETEALKLIAGRAVNLAKIVLDSADNYIEIDTMVDEADARGYDLVKRDDEDESEDERWSQ